MTEPAPSKLRKYRSVGDRIHERTSIGIAEDGIADFAAANAVGEDAVANRMKQALPQPVQPQPKVRGNIRDAETL